MRAFVRHSICAGLYELDIGYTGRLTARYLSQHPQRSSFTLAVAGRSRSKLDALELDAGVQVFVVDVTDETAVEELVKQFKVIANTVGPYWRWGTPVVKYVYNATGLECGDRITVVS